MKNETESVSSSITHVTARDSKIITKRVGLNLKAHPQIRHSWYSLSLGLFLTTLFTICFLVIVSINNRLWRTSRTLFSVYSSLAMVDNQFRGSLQIYFERFLLFNSLLYSEAWAPRLTEDERVYRLNLSVYTHNTALTVLNTPNLIQFLINEVNAKKNAFSKSIKSFAGNELLADAPQQLKSLLLDSRFDVFQYDGISNAIVSQDKLSGVTFLKDFRARLEVLQGNLIKLKPHMEGKKPPFGIPPKILKSEFVDAVPLRFSALKNSLNGTLEFHRKWLGSIKEIAVSTQTKQYEINRAILYSIFFLFYSAFIVGSLLLAWKMNRRLFRIVSQLAFLRSEELLIHKFIYGHRSSILQGSRYDELQMIEECLNSNGKVLSDHTGQGELRRFGKSGPGLNSGQKKIFSVKIKHNFTFKSSKVLSVTTLLSLLVVVFFWLILQAQAGILNNVLEMASFYMETYERFRDASDFYMFHSILTIFGNFIMIEGETAETVIHRMKDQQQIPNLVNFVMQQRQAFRQFFGAVKGAQIEDALYSNLCSHLDPLKTTFKEDLFVCENNFFAKQGFVSFMNNEKDVLYGNRLMVFGNPSFLEKTKTDFLVFPFQTRLFLPSSLNFRIAHKLVFETMMTLILSAGEEKINYELQRVEQLNTKYFQAPSYLVIALFSVCFIACNLAAIRSDLRVCDECFYNLLPVVIYQNKLIYRELQQVHITAH